MIFEERNSIVVLLLAFFTCGIYGLYWEYEADFNLQKKGFLQNSPILDIILCLLTCGLYNIYLLYRISKQIAEIQLREEVMVDDQSILCIILSIFGFGIVAIALLQENMNKTNSMVLSKYDLRDF